MNRATSSFENTACPGRYHAHKHIFETPAASIRATSSAGVRRLEVSSGDTWDCSNKRRTSGRPSCDHSVIQAMDKEQPSIEMILKKHLTERILLTSGGITGLAQTSMIGNNICTMFC